MNEAALRDATLSTALLCEAVALVEEAGPLEDSAAMRDAVRQATPHARISQRALSLGQRIGLPQELARARQWAPWIALALVALIVVAGLSLAGSVTGEADRHINIMVALVSLLGLHLLTLIVWLIGLVLPSGAFKLSLGWLWITLTARVAGGQRGQGPALLRAAMQLLTRARLLPWAFGFVSHAIWALSFIVVLGAWLFALAFRRYTLGWETTILEPGVFVQAVRWLGVVPGWLGFPVPDASAVLTPASAAGDQRAWAMWLTGCIVAYGLLPRLLFLGASAWVWRHRQLALRPDLSTPYNRRLIARFEALAPAQIVDRDPGLVRSPTSSALSPDEVGSTNLLVGYELPDDQPWPPANLPASVHLVMKTDGSAAARRELLDRVAQQRPHTVYIACHASSSPDRGTERLLREVLAHSGACQLWLMGGDEASRARWRRWLTDSGLSVIAAHDTLARAMESAA